MVSDRLDEIVSNQKDLLAANYLAPLSTSYLPWSRYAMRPSGLVQVLNEIFGAGGYLEIQDLRLFGSRNFSIPFRDSKINLLMNQGF